MAWLALLCFLFLWRVGGDWNPAPSSMVPLFIVRRVSFLQFLYLYLPFPFGPGEIQGFDWTTFWPSGRRILETGKRFRPDSDAFVLGAWEKVRSLMVTIDCNYISFLPRLVLNKRCLFERFSIRKEKIGIVSAQFCETGKQLRLMKNDVIHAGSLN